MKINNIDNIYIFTKPIMTKKQEKHLKIKILMSSVIG